MAKQLTDEQAAAFGRYVAAALDERVQEAKDNEEDIADVLEENEAEFWSTLKRVRKGGTVDTPAPTGRPLGSDDEDEEDEDDEDDDPIFDRGRRREAEADAARSSGPVKFVPGGLPDDLLNRARDTMRGPLGDFFAGAVPPGHPRPTPQSSIVSCPGCGQKNRVPDGKIANCAKCKTPL